MRCERRWLWAPVVVGLLACGGPSTQMGPSTERPAWLQELIEAFQAAPPTNPPASIVRRAYEAGVYYYVPPRCCDIPGDLYSVDGTLVCHPDGGFGGGGDGACPALGELRSEEIVWQDPRG